MNQSHSGISAIWGKNQNPMANVLMMSIISSPEMTGNSMRLLFIPIILKLNLVISQPRDMRPISYTTRYANVWPAEKSFAGQQSVHSIIPSGTIAWSRTALWSRPPAGALP